jgi:hypothetical protein
MAEKMVVDVLAKAIRKGYPEMKLTTQVATEYAGLLMTHLMRGIKSGYQVMAVKGGGKKSYKGELLDHTSTEFWGRVINAVRRGCMIGVYDGRDYHFLARK